MWDARLAKTGLAKPNGVGQTKTVLVRPMRNKGSTKMGLVQAAKRTRAVGVLFSQ